MELLKFLKQIPASWTLGIWEFPVSGTLGNYKFPVILELYSYVWLNSRWLRHREYQIAGVPNINEMQKAGVKCKMLVSGIPGNRNKFKVEKITGVRDTSEMRNAGVWDTGESGITSVPDTASNF